MRKDNYTSVMNSSLYVQANTSTSKPFFSKCPGAIYSVYKEQKPPEPNIALISIMLLIGTCVLALSLKKLRRSNFFGSYVLYLNFYIFK